MVANWEVPELIQISLLYLYTEDRDDLLDKSIKRQNDMKVPEAVPIDQCLSWQERLFCMQSRKKETITISKFTGYVLIIV